MMEYKDYLRPQTLDEAIKTLNAVDGRALIFAGGTDILVNARESERYADCTIVDIYGLDGLCDITEQADTLTIGAGVTHTQVEASPLVQRYAPILSRASGTVGSAQIRNHSTLAGNIANASPAADTLASLAVLDAQVVVNRGGQSVTLPLAQVVTGPYKTSLADRDLITAIIINKLPAGAASAYYKLGRRKALAISRLTIAGALHRGADGRVDWFCMTVGAVFPRPMVFEDVNAMLVGKDPTEEDVAAVAKALSDKIPEIAGVRKSTTYKQPVTRNLIARILASLVRGEDYE